jgi:hypothetical protein
VERILANKLGSFATEVVESAVNSKGESVRDYLKKKQKELRGFSKRLSAKFWVDFFEEFELKKSPAEGLRPPPDEEHEVREELLNAMTVAHRENPASRNVEPLELF